MPKVSVDPGTIARICQRYGIRELSLFGSVIRDDFRPESDVDVLVEFDAQARVGLFELMDIQDELASLFGREVDVVTKKSVSKYFRDDVLAHREVLYVQA